MTVDNKEITKITDFIEKSREEIIDFALQSVKASSVNPPGDETAYAELITKKARQWSMPEPDVLSPKDKRVNLIFSNPGSAEGKRLVLSGHMDTKPLGDASEWKESDPEKPGISNGRLYGRGSTDMKGALTSMLAAVYAIRKAGVEYHGDLSLLFTSDEEAGSTYGAKYIAEQGFEADAILIGEPSGNDKNFDTIGLASRGVLLGKILVHGTQMHSSLSDKGGCVNASLKMAKVMLEFGENLKKRLNYKKHYLYPDGPTINPGVKIEGGVYYGVIPGEAQFYFDLRVIPGMEYDQLIKDINDFLKDLKKDDDDIDAELVLEDSITPWIPGVEIDKDHKLVQSCIDATNMVLDFEPEKIGVPFGTDASFIVSKLGIPTISSFGPGYIKLAHGPDEYVDVDSIIDAAKIYAIASLKYLNS